VLDDGGSIQVVKRDQGQAVLLRVCVQVSSAPSSQAAQGGTLQGNGYPRAWNSPATGMLELTTMHNELRPLVRRVDTRHG
jgi:hypothetical protein